MDNNKLIMDAEIILLIEKSICLDDELLFYGLTEVYLQYPHTNEWGFVCSGVLCFVRDFNNCYSFKMLSLKLMSNIWWIEWSKDTPYSCQNNELHFTHNGHNLRLNFHDERYDQDSFRNMLKNVEAPKTNPSLIRRAKNRVKELVNGKESSIGAPKNFAHITHIGRDDYFNYDPDLMVLLFGAECIARITCPRCG